MCCLYSIPNLLVIQHLETLYFGGNNVRVVCDKGWRINQVCASRSNSWLDLMTNSRVVPRQNEAYVWSMQEDEESGQLDHYRTKSTVWPSLETGEWNLRLIPVTSDSPVHLVLLKSDFSHSISYPTINTLIPTKCREFIERLLREKP